MKKLSLFIVCALIPFVMNGQNAVVSATNMNVLYLGIANPVEIAVPGVSIDKVTATVTNGKITRTINGWEITPDNFGDCIITIMSGNKKVAEKTFRVKQVAVPVAVFAGISNGILSKETALKEGYLEVRIPDFAWDLKYTIESFTLTFSSRDISAKGNMLTDEMKAEITRMVRGQSMIFNNILAKAPDGHIVTMNSIAVKLE